MVLSTISFDNRDLSTIFCPPLLFSVHFSVHLDGHGKQMFGEIFPLAKIVTYFGIAKYLEGKYKIVETDVYDLSDWLAQ